MNKFYNKRFQMFSESLSDPELVNYARKDGNNTFSRKRKMHLKDMLLCCLSKKMVNKHLNSETILKIKETCLCSYLYRAIYNRENV